LALALGDQVLDETGIAADVEERTGAGPDQGRARSLRFGLVFFLLLARRRLDHMESSSLERLRAHFATGLFRLLGGAIHDLRHPLAVLAGVRNDRQGDRQIRVFLAHGRDRQGSLGNVQQFLKGHADLVLECIARVLELRRKVLAEVLQRRVVPELAVLALAK
jgi:hypothetical protein